MKYFSESGFKRSFLKVDIVLHGMESPVYTLVGKMKHSPTNLTITILIPSFRTEWHFRNYQQKTQNGAWSDPLFSIMQYP